MAFNPSGFGQTDYSDFFGDDGPFQNSSAAGANLFNGRRTTNALQGSQGDQESAFSALGSAALNAKGDYEQAKAYADAYKEQQDRARSAQRKRSGVGGILGLAGTAVGLVNPLAGAGLKGIGALFG